MTELTRVPLLVCDQPTDETGRIYPKQVIQEAIDKLNQTVQVLYGSVGIQQSVTMDLATIAFAATNLQITEENILVADIRILPTAQGFILERMMHGHQDVKFRLAGLGHLDNDCITQYTFSSIGAVLLSQDQPSLMQ